MYFGFVTLGSGIIPRILNAAPTTAITNADCARRWSSNQITDGHVCFFSGSTGACNVKPTI